MLLFTVSFLFGTTHLSVSVVLLCYMIDQVRIGQHITRAQADRFLRNDLRVAESAVNRYVKVPLRQNEFDALASFTFNVGNGALAGSTLLKKLNAGLKSQVPSEMRRWNKGRINGILTPIAGLTKRRNREAELWQRP